MRREILIHSFYRPPVDLAAAMRDWREFTAGEGCDVDLEDERTGEKVEVRYVESWDDDHFSIKSDTGGELFERVTGRVVRLLSEHGGYLKIRREPYDEKRLMTPKFK